MSESKKKIDPEEIVARYYHDIYKFCCARCRDADAAQDLTQETFAVLLEKREELTPDNVRAWLFSVAYKQQQVYFREKAVEKEYVGIYDVPLEPAFGSPVEEEVLAAIAFDETQQKILNILTEKERDLFIRLYLEKKSVSLIRRELGITDANFRQRKHRVKKKVEKVVNHTSFLFMVLAFKWFH